MAPTLEAELKAAAVAAATRAARAALSVKDTGLLRCGMGMAEGGE